jgi:pimeloyl-ACP methyl ester carboxylesterase
MTFDHMSKDLDQFINNNKIVNPILIGHSLGGRVIMHYSIKNSYKIKKIVNIDISPRDFSQTCDSGRLLLEEMIDTIKKINITQYNSVLDASNAINSLMLHKSLSSLLKRNITFDNKITNWLFNLNCIADEFSKLSCQIGDNNIITTTNTLFIKGEKSEFLRMDEKQYIHLKFPNSKFSIIPNSGHWLHLTHRDTLLNVLVQFIDNE